MVQTARVAIPRRGERAMLGTGDAATFDMLDMPNISLEEGRLLLDGRP